MAIEGHAPTVGPGRKLHYLGQGVCPDCLAPLEPVEGDDYECTACGEIWPIARCS